MQEQHNKRQVNSNENIHTQQNTPSRKSSLPQLILSWSNFRPHKILGVTPESISLDVPCYQILRLGSVRYEHVLETA